MLDIYLSDKCFKGILNKSNIYSFHVKQLAQIINSLDALYSHQYPNIKRLTGQKPTVWRYRIGDDRIIFTTISSPQSSIIIHKIGHRSTVYKQLPHYFPSEFNTHLENLIIHENNDHNIQYDINDIGDDTQFQDCDRYYKLSYSLINNDVNSDAITKFIIKGEYRFNPCLNSAQINQINDINPHNSLVYQIQGTAGTGKTTLAFFLADKVANENIFPIIITPNKQLKKFGDQCLKSLNPDVKILENEFEENLDNHSYNMALFNRNELIQKLAGDNKATLTASQGCKIIRDLLKKRTNRIDDFNHINIYGILQSFIIDKSYNYCSNDKDALTTSYQDVIDFLRQVWKKEYHSIFDAKDAISQGKKALNNLPNSVDWFKKLAKNKSILFIIDEIQDFYWFQLKIFLDLAFNHQLSITIILLGDENQRVTISGFSWANFRTIFVADNYDKKALVDGINLTQNFRNTKQIASVAKYFLEEDFIKHITINQKKKSRKLPDIGDPNECYDDGLKPRLIIIDNKWLQNFLDCIKNDKKSKQEEDNIISQIIFVKRDLFSFSNKITEEKFTELEDKEILTSYTISEAKGQEFEAIVILFLFQNSIKQLGFDDLFEYYTAITRARYYLSILVTENELHWLKNTITNIDKLESLFDIQESLNPEDFAQELKIHGQSLITIQQRQQKFINNIVNHDLSQWLERGILPTNLTKKWESLKLTWWQLLEEIVDKLDELTENKDLSLNVINLDKIIISPMTDIKEIIIFCYGVKYLYYQGGLNIQQIILIQRKIVKFLQNNESISKQLFLELDKIKFTDLKALILVANNLSWKAVSLLQEDSTKNKLYHKELEIKEIALQLEEKGLSYEAMRIRQKFLDKSPVKNIPFAEVLNQEGELVTLLCQHFINQLSEE